jgi:hypothetical protein
MKRAVILLLVFSMLLQIFSNVVIIVNYVINKEYISKTFCENRNKPKMHCNGKCHLMKQLQKENKKEKSPLATIKGKAQVQFFENTYRFSFFSPSAAINSFPAHPDGKVASVIIPVFHPPSFC